jgi:S-DNA-T family DNA segregation ATPase FtsK/SpoIIIE
MTDNNKPRNGGTAGTVLFAVVSVAGLVIWTRPVLNWRTLLARLADVLAPWLLGAAVLAVAVALAMTLIRRRAGRSSLLRRWWRTWWHYRRGWARMMTLHSLVTIHDQHTLVPRLRTVEVGEHSDTLHVRMVPGQAPDDWETRSDALAHAFGAHAARVRVERPSLLGIDLRYGDTLAQPIPLAARRQDRSAA